MSAPTDVRSQLRTLSIPTESRPGADTAARRGFRAVRTVIVLVLLLAAGAGAWLGREKLTRTFSDLAAAAASPKPIRVHTVALSQPPDAGAMLTATGKIVSDHRVQVATKVSGQIVGLFFEQGDRVERGQLLARIEDVNYRAPRDEAAARLAQSRAALEFQKINFERVSHLMTRNVAEPIEFADAQRSLREAEARVDQDRAALEYAQKALDDTEVAAPIAGVVLTRNVEVGDFVSAEGGRGANANAQFAVIADMTRLRVEVDISELDIVRIHKDMPCVITPDAYKDRKYDGFVLWIDPGANYSKATVQAKVRINQPDDYLRVEGSAQVAFYNRRPDESPRETSAAIWIPASAVRQGEDAARTATVLVATDGRWRERIVAPGRHTGSFVEILEGLVPGDRIAAEGLDRIQPGQAVVLPQ
jgi:RND family efflux transporter MFP subunit